MQQLERALRADGVGDQLDGGRVVEVAAGGGLDQQQVVADQRAQYGDVLPVEADARGDVLDDGLAGHRVVARPSLADVVEQCGDQQQVGAADPADGPGGADGGLDQVTVDRPDVDGVALGAAADPLPVGQQPGDQPFGVQGVPDVHGGTAGAEQGDQLFPGLGGPGHRHRRRVGGQPPHGVQRQRQSRLGGRGGGAQREDGVAVRPGGAGQHDLTVLFHDAFGERGALRGRAAAAEQRAQPGPGRAGPQHPADLAPGDVAGVGDDAGGLVHLAQQDVGVEQAEAFGDLVLLLQGETVGGSPGGEVEGVADVEEGAAGGVEALARGVGQPGGGDGAQRGGVAETAVGLLEVGFEEEAQFAGAVGALGAQVAQFGQAPGSLVAPVGEDGGAQAGGEGQVAGQVAGVEQAELDLEVVGGGPARLGGGADRVVQGEAQVPDGVPEPVGDGGDRGRVGAVVQEQQVEVAAWGELPAAVAADGDQGEPTGAGRGGGEQSGQPAVGEFGKGLTARRPGPGLLLEEAQPGRRVAAGSRVLGLFTCVRARHPATPVPPAAPQGFLWLPYRASGPRSPVRTRTAVSTGTAQTLPSPILPVRAALTTTSMS